MNCAIDAGGKSGDIASGAFVIVNESGAAADTKVSNIWLDAVVFFKWRQVVGRRTWNAIKSVDIVLHGKGPESSRDTSMVKQCGCMFVDVTSTTFFCNGVHFLMRWWRNFESDAVVEAKLLKCGEKRRIILDESLTPIHAYFRRCSNFETSGLNGIHQGSRGGFFVKEDKEKRRVAGKRREIFSTINGSYKGTVHIHAESVNGVIRPVATN